MLAESDPAVPLLDQPRRALRHKMRAGDLALFAVLAVVAFFIIYPVIVVVWNAIVSAATDPASVRQSLGDPDLLLVLFNTVAIVAASGILAILAGSLCAWLNERTDAGGSGIERLMPLVPLMVPSIAGVVGWVTLLSPRAGLINVLLRNLLGGIGIKIGDGPLNIFSWPGYIFVLFLYLFPFVYALMVEAFASLDPALEEAAAVNRAGALQTFRKVTLPALKPALSASVLIVIIQGVANFTVAIVIGTGASIDVLSARIYRLLYNYPPNVEQAVFISLFMTIVVQAAMLLQRSILRKERFAIVGGKASRASRVKLGAWRLPARILVALYLLLTSIVPFAGLVLVSLQSFWTANFSWKHLTLDNYWLAIVKKGVTGQAIVDSLLLGAIGGLIGIGIAAWVALGVQRRPPWMARIADFVLSLPSALPHSIVGVSFILAFSQGWLNLRGTFALLLIAYLVMFLPQAAGAATSASSVIGRDLVEAARLSHAPGRTILRRVQLPLMLPVLFSGWVILFVHMAGELTASALLAGQGTPVVGLVLLDLWENGSFPELSATAVVITVVFSIAVLLSLWITRRRVA